MSPSCLALLLSLVSACTLPGSPVALHVSLSPRPDLCVQYQQRAPVCVAGLLATLGQVSSLP